MTTRQIELIETSFAQVKPIAETAAELFYNRLFELDPSLRALFRGDMKEQGRKLMGMLALVVAGLRQLDRFVPAIEDMGRRHSNYGVQDEHYQTVGAALLWTLGAGLGDGFTAEVEDAWTVAYTLLASVMRNACTVAVAA